MSNRGHTSTSLNSCIGRKGVILQAQARSIIYKVAMFFKEESEKDAWRVDIKKWVTRASEATGVSANTIRKIFNEGKSLDQEEGCPKFVTPEKKPRKPVVSNPDSFDEEVIRRIVLDDYVQEKARPSLKVLHGKVSNSTSFTGGVSSLRIIVQNLGLSTEKDGPTELGENRKRCLLQNNSSLKCYDVNCGKSGNWKTLWAHYQKDHKLSASPVIHQFSSYSEFESWKQNLEKTEGTNYVAYERKKLKTNYRYTKTFRCKPSLNTKDGEIPHGALKTGIYCPAQLKITVDNERVEVFRISFHLGHGCSSQGSAALTETLSERVEMDGINTVLDRTVGSPPSTEDSGDDDPVVISSYQDHDYHRPVNLGNVSKKKMGDQKKRCSKTKNKISLECHLTNCEANGDWKTLWDHYVRDHKLSVSPVIHKFGTYSEFWAWKQSVEKAEKVTYVSSWGAKMLETTYPLKKTFRCNRSGVYDPAPKNGDGQKSTKSQGSLEEGIFCPAHMKVTLELDRVEVSHVSCHLGYNLDMGHHRLSAKDKVVRSRKMSNGAPNKPVLDTVLNPVLNEDKKDDLKTSLQESVQVDIKVDPVVILQNQEQDYIPDVIPEDFT